MTNPTRKKDKEEHPAEARAVHRDDIVAAAATAFRRFGYRGATLNDIADLVGIRKASLYHHIRSKEELLLNILDNGIATSSQELRTLVESDLTPCEKLERAVHMHVLLTTEQMIGHAVFINDFDVVSDKKHLDAYLDRRKQYEAHFRQIVSDCLQLSGNHNDPHLVTLAILGMCNYTPRWYQPDGRASAEKIATEFAQLATRMVGCG